MKINLRNALLGIGGVLLYLWSIQSKGWKFLSDSSMNEYSGVVFIIGTVSLLVVFILAFFIYLDKLNTYLASIVVYETPKEEVKK